MDPNVVIDRMKANAAAFKSLAEGIDQTQARWKPAPEKWSILEVVSHLYDEERDDFRRRLGLTLEDPKKKWPPIDPPAWVIERRYNERSLPDSVQHFLEERKKSVEWLKNLKDPDWQAEHEHPSLGRMSAETILVNWLAHDLLHIRQLTGLHWAWLSQQTKPGSLGYAGPW